MVHRGSTSPNRQPILQLQRELEDFRSSHPGRTKLPESLWQVVVELARQYGIYPVASFTAGLHGFDLKKRLSEVTQPHCGKAAPPTFVEVVAAQPPGGVHH